MTVLKRVIVALVVLVGGAVGWWWWQGRAAEPAERSYREVEVKRGTVRVVVQTTGVVRPQNRLEVIPPTPGRIEDLLVDEGDAVEKGQILAWMSSSERAVLLDAAAAQGPKEVARWKDLYRPTPLIAPLDGMIIARNVEPGQRVNLQTAIFVMSNRLIVRARVDETDIGRVAEGQKALVTLDAYPDQTVQAKVRRIAHEARTVSNVTIYEVDLLLKRIPLVFRSGMTATVIFIVEERRRVLVLPLTAVMGQGEQPEVLLPGGVPRPVRIGLADGKIVEIVEGVEVGEVVLVPEVGMPWLVDDERPRSAFDFRRRRRGRSRGGSSRRSR